MAKDKSKKNAAKKMLESAEPYPLMDLPLEGMMSMPPQYMTSPEDQELHSRMTELEEGEQLAERFKKRGKVRPDAHYIANSRKPLEFSATSPEHLRKLRRGFDAWRVKEEKYGLEAAEKEVSLLNNLAQMDDGSPDDASYRKRKRMLDRYIDLGMVAPIPPEYERELLRGEGVQDRRVSEDNVLDDVEFEDRFGPEGEGMREGPMVRKGTDFFPHGFLYKSRSPSDPYGSSGGYEGLDNPLKDEFYQYGQEPMSKAPPSDVEDEEYLERLKAWLQKHGARPGRRATDLKKPMLYGLADNPNTYKRDDFMLKEKIKKKGK
tara:strand:- start:24 stop:980 length:957 start_codon:yes stop_codon:yes gene_type:complete